ncbi:hypothetical protein PHYBOEH_004612 [Phytophthora boehmeriae]|uniref:F-box domain-containing protein n=1 Tax=Phytophthora boehmeriae TaxID=109152 RepID=A0A8T1WN65_9STRA|nr:hypothetical protein PHYBOEH_004612 [Phytophthora boehmeriae]
MEKLPLLLFSSVLSFAVESDDLVYTEELLPNPRELPQRALRQLALVCKSWLKSIRELTSQFHLSTLTLRIRSHSDLRSELQDFRRQLLQRGSQVLDLRICIGELSTGHGFYPRRRAISVGRNDAPPLDDVAIDWDSLLLQLPSLKRLDLARMPLESPLVKAIVDAAAENCPHLKILILPGQHWPNNRMLSADPVDVDPILDAVYAGLQKWRGSGGGLRQLAVPTLNDEDRFRSVEKFIQNVISYCPSVEYLDGYLQSLCDRDSLSCRQQWHMTLKQWEEFNTVCTNLREFNWVVVPFGDPFFRAFGAHVKPHLKKLQIGVNMLWDWQQYFTSSDEALRVARTERDGSPSSAQRPGFGFQATDVSSALKGCPALQELMICLYHPVDPTVDEGFIDLEDVDQNAIPTQEMLNMDVFDDSFCDVLAVSCPMVTRLEITEVAQRFNPRLLPIRTFTDAGLISLAKLAFLTTLRLRPINCTGKGLFELLNGLSGECSGQRTFELCLGGGSKDSWMDYYASLEELMRLLGEADPQEFSRAYKKFVLRVRNSRLCLVDAQWSEIYLANLERLVKRVKDVHPSLCLRVVTTGGNGKSFECIIEYGVYSIHAEPSEWYRWDDDESDRDVIFASRGHGAPDRWEDDDDVRQPYWRFDSLSDEDMGYDSGSWMAEMASDADFSDYSPDEYDEHPDYQM